MAADVDVNVLELNEAGDGALVKFGNRCRNAVTLAKLACPPRENACCTNCWARLTRTPNFQDDRPAETLVSLLAVYSFPANARGKFADGPRSVTPPMETTPMASPGRKLYRGSASSWRG